MTAPSPPSRSAWYREKCELLPLMSDVSHSNPHDGRDPVNTISHPTILSAVVQPHVGSLNRHRQGMMKTQQTEEGAVDDLLEGSKMITRASPASGVTAAQAESAPHSQQRRFQSSRRRDSTSLKRSREEQGADRRKTGAPSFAVVESASNTEGGADRWTTASQSQQQRREGRILWPRHLASAALRRSRNVPSEEHGTTVGLSLTSSDASSLRDVLLQGVEDDDVYKSAASYLKRSEWIAQRRYLGQWSGLTEAERATAYMKHVDEMRKSFSRERKSRTDAAASQ
mmetsp:Transcript_28534/g.32986  ORF Transcript_28534/g.32986 Transcript_28534/m.32986 type:complete len:284 (+) Transcript_28534:74-925(+)